ncbi:hypothetical protein ACFWZ6_02740 [Streptomyces massasporeus]
MKTPGRPTAQLGDAEILEGGHSPMRHIARRAALAALTSLAVTASLTAGATNAFAINEGTCSRSDFLHITIHRPGENAQMRCYANAGEADLLSANWWVTRMSQAVRPRAVARRHGRSAASGSRTATDEALVPENVRLGLALADDFAVIH